MIDNDRASKDAAALLERLLAVRARVPQNQEAIDAAVFASRRVLFTARKNLARIALAGRCGQARARISHRQRRSSAAARRVARAEADYARLWQKENRPWWLNRVLDKYDRLGHQLLDLDKVVFVQPENSVAEGKRRISLATHSAINRSITPLTAGIPSLALRGMRFHSGSTAAR